MARITQQGSIHTTGTSYENEPIVKSDSADDSVYQWSASSGGDTLDVFEDENNKLRFKVNSGGGEVVTFGTEDSSDTLADGKLMYLATDDKWRYADADSSATGGNQLLALAIGDTVAKGLLVKGLFTGTITDWDAGLPVYISTAVGTMTTTMPTGTGDIVRKVGYCTPTTNQLWFDPSSDFVELA